MTGIASDNAGSQVTLPEQKRNYLNEGRCDTGRKLGRAGSDRLPLITAVPLPLIVCPWRGGCHNAIITRDALDLTVPTRPQYQTWDFLWDLLPCC